MNSDKETYLKTFFGGTEWTISENTKQEHNVIVSEISDNDIVLDLGCGYNLFKGRIKNLTAIDKYNPAADILVDMLDFQSPDDHYDVIIALGSTNIKPVETIHQQIENIVKWCKPGGRIYMRVNPRLVPDNDTPEYAYGWKLEEIIMFTQKYNLKIIKPITVTDKFRITWTWQKPE